MKHGLLINDIVITNGALKEDQDEFHAHLAGLRDSYQPRDVAEDLLVQEIAISYWRGLRSLRCERGDLSFNAGYPDESELSEWELRSLSEKPASEAYSFLLRSSRGIKFLIRMVEDAHDEVFNHGFVSSEIGRWLRPGEFWNTVAFGSVRGLLAGLEEEIERLTVEKQRVEREESQRRSDERDRRAIPTKEVLDRINRYETSNLRHR